MGWAPVGAVAVALLVSACGTHVVDLSVPEEFVAHGQAPLAEEFRVFGTTKKRTDISFEEYITGADTAPVLVAEVDRPFCEMVSLVLGDVGKVPHTCSGDGRVSFDTGTTVPGNVAVEGFLRSIVSQGASVFMTGRTLTVRSPALAVSRSSDVQSRLEPSSDAGDDGVFDVMANAELPPILLSDDQVFREPEGDGIVSFPTTGDVSVVPGSLGIDGVRDLVSTMNLPLRVALVAGDVVVSGGGAARRALLEVLGAVGPAVLQVEAGSLPRASLSALAAAYPAVEVHSDDAGGVVYLRGPASEAAKLYGALERVRARRSLIEVVAQLVEVSEATVAELALEGVSYGFSGASNIGLSSTPQGYELGARVGDFSILARALASDDTARVVSRPRLRFRSGLEASFVSGEQVPIATRRTDNDTGETFESFEYRDTGVVFTASGSIRSDGTINLDVRLEVSAVADVSGPSPTFTTREYKSSLTLDDGAAFLVSGLSGSGASSSVDGLASWLPLSSARGASRRELVLLLTARSVALGRAEARSRWGPAHPG